MTEETKYMTIEEAADFTKGKLQDKPQGWSVASIRRAAGLGWIPGAKRFGKSWMIPEDGLMVWMKDQVLHRTGPKN